MNLEIYLSRPSIEAGTIKFRCSDETVINYRNYENVSTIVSKFFDRFSSHS